MLKVGFSGLGFMGGPMVANLARRGFPVVLQNRTKSKAEDLINELESEGVLGLGRVDTPGSLVTEGCEVICLCLATEQASWDVLFAKEGIFETLSKTKRNLIIVDHSTVSPKLTLECAEAAKSLGCIFLDAPISGGPEGAAAGTLAIMAGGDLDAYERALPVLRAMGSTVKRMGASGTGTAMKLVNQQLVGIHTTAASEAILFAQSLGLTDKRAMLDILRNAYGYSRMADRTGELWAAAEETDSMESITSSAAPLRLITKDLTIISDYANGAGLRLPTTSITTDLYRSMRKATPDHDISWSLRFLDGGEKPEEKKGVKT